MNRGICFGVAFFLLFFTGACFGAPNMDEGLWEITTTVDMPGMGSRSFTHTSCLTKEKAVPQRAESGCTVKDMKTQGNTVTWTVVCKEGMSKSTGKVTYTGSTMDGVVETTVKAGGQTMMMKSTMKGKRIGPCKSS